MSYFNQIIQRTAPAPPAANLVSPQEHGSFGRQAGEQDDPFQSPVDFSRSPESPAAEVMPLEFRPARPSPIDSYPDRLTFPAFRPENQLETKTFIRREFTTQVTPAPESQRITPAEPATGVQKKEKANPPREPSDESRPAKKQELVPERSKEQWRLSKPEKEISPVTELDLRPVRPRQPEPPKEMEIVQKRAPAQESHLKPKPPKPKEETVRKQTDSMLQPRSRGGEAAPIVRQKTGPRLSIGKITVEITAPAKPPGTVQTRVVYRSQPAATSPVEGAGLRYNSRFGLSQI